jgi:hypothetical protein
MTNWMEITGISLQLLAGLVLVLDQIAHKFLTNIETWVGSVRTFITGKGKRRWRIVILFSLVALPVIIIALAKLGTNEAITWAAIGGVLIFTLIGFNAYALLLILVGKRTLRGDIGKHINSLIEDEKIVSVNVQVFIISCVFTAVIFFIIRYILPKLDNSVLGILLSLILVVCMLVFLPALIFSFLFVLGEGLVRFINKMGKVPAKYYWIAIVVLWVAGGGFLLANALCS